MDAESDLYALVEELTEIPGPVGHEDAVQDRLVERWGRIAGEVRRSRVGNVLARVGGRGPRLVLAAHADEICLMVKSVSEEGFLHLWPYYNDTRGHPPRSFMPAGQPALVVTDDGLVDGVIATASGHVVGGRHSQQDRLEWNDLFVDVGASSRDGVQELGIAPGNRVIWNPPTRRLGSRIVGKAMDDRAALAIGSIAAERVAGHPDLAYELWLASTVQEENGLIGAASLADEERFDAAIALDVGPTGDIPGPDARDFPSKLGGGPIVVFQDATCHYSRRLSSALIRTAARANLPVQRAVFQHYGSDGAALIRRGVETALLTYPTRYTHSPIETVDEADLAATVDLLTAFLTTPPPR